MSNIIKMKLERNKQQEKHRCPKCGEKLLYWELTCPNCETIVRTPENDHIDFYEKSEFGALVYRAE